MRRSVIAAVVVLAFVGCSSSKSSTPTTTSQPASVSTTRPTSATRPENLEVTDSVRAALVAAFAAGRHLDPTYVAGTVGGSVYYAYDPSTDTYWALSDFSASDAAQHAHEQLSGTPNDPLIQFQDGPMVLSGTNGSNWRLVTDTGGLVCPPRPPAAVLALWGVGGGSDCSG